MCEWGSTMPGMRVRPRPSTTGMPSGTGVSPRVPTAAIFPARTTRTPSSMRPRSEAVSRLAPTTAKSPAGGREASSGAATPTPMPAPAPMPMPMERSAAVQGTSLALARLDQGLDLRAALLGHAVRPAPAAGVEEHLRALHDAQGVRQALRTFEAEQVEAEIDVLGADLVPALHVRQVVDEQEDALL